jgi:hypothetical protein
MFAEFSEKGGNADVGDKRQSLNNLIKINTKLLSDDFLYCFKNEHKEWLKLNGDMFKTIF